MRPKFQKSHVHSPAHAEVERVSPLEGSSLRSACSGGGGGIGGTADMAVSGGGFATMLGVAMHEVMLDNTK
jgi:hypothetical protein